MKLLFEPDKIPRTTTREQWKKLWRWKRETEKRLSRHEEELVLMLREPMLDFVAFGTARFRADLIDHLVNPPLLIPDYETGRVK